MPTTLLLPPLDDTAVQMIVEQVYCTPNDPIVQGQPLLMVRSDRFVWSIPATTSGTLVAIHAAPGTAIQTGAAVAEIGETTQESAKPASRLETALPSRGRVRATPSARKVAHLHGIDLAVLNGTGYRSAITRADVFAAIGEQNQKAAVRDVTEETTVANNIANTGVLATPVVLPSRRLEANTNLDHPLSAIPTALTMIDVDLTEVIATQNQHRARLARRGVTLTVTACVAWAAVAALADHRAVNSAWSDEGIIVRSHVHLLAQHAAESGIRSQIVRDAADLNLIGLARQLAHGTNGSIGDVQPTFGVSERQAPWWTHEQLDGSYAAHITIGMVQQQPHVIETTIGDQIAIRPSAFLTLTYDARAIDQAQGDAFLCAIKHRLERLNSLC